MPKKTSPRVTQILTAELVQLNQAHADAVLAKEKFEHHITKGHLMRALYDVSRLQSELNALKIEQSAKLKAEQQVSLEKEALTHRQAKDKLLEDLAKELRRRYDVGDKFAIDPLSGDFINLEA